MIIGAEFAMLGIGIYILFKGKMFPNPKAKYVVQGWPVRVMGLIYILPIPLAIPAGIALGVWGVLQGKDVSGPSFFWVRTGMEGSIVVLCLVAAAIISRVYRVPVEKAQGESTPA